MSTFSVVNESTLAAAIDKCKKRLVYIAPGITEKVVKAMKKMLTNPDQPALTVIIDTDPEVYRLGYGTIEGLKALQKLAREQQIPVRYQDGLRIGVLIIDDQILAYAPTPLLIEAGSSKSDKPNAIKLGIGNPLKRIIRAAAAEGSDDAQAPSAAEVGKKEATPARIAESLEQLEKFPPKRFDVARTERVYNTKLQYVEFEVNGYRLETKKVKVPAHLVVDKSLVDKMHNSYSLLDGIEKLKTEIEGDASGARISYSADEIEKERKQIYTDFLISITGHGQIISKTRRPEFDKRVLQLRTRVERFADAVRPKLKEAIELSLQKITEGLLPNLIKNPPPQLCKASTSTKPSEAELRKAVRLELEKAFKVVDNINEFYQPSVKVVFKELTYETITDSKFSEQLKRAFPDLVIYEEHQAAPEVDPKSSR